MYKLSEGGTHLFFDFLLWSLMQSPLSIFTSSHLPFKSLSLDGPLGQLKNPSKAISF